MRLGNASLAGPLSKPASNRGQRYLLGADPGCHLDGADGPCLNCPVPPRDSLACFQRGLRRIVAAHAVDAAARRGGGRAEVDPLPGWCTGSAGHRAGEELAQVLDAAVDVAADVVGIVRLDLGGACTCRRPGCAIAKAGRKALDLRARCARSCRRSSRSARGNRPRRCACPAGARVGSNRLCCASRTKGRSGCSPAPHRALRAADLIQCAPKMHRAARALRRGSTGSAHPAPSRA